MPIKVNLPCVDGLFYIVLLKNVNKRRICTPSVLVGEEVVNIQRMECPNPKCKRRIFDIDVIPQGKIMLEMKCRHCGEIIRVGFSPKKVHKRNKRQG